MPWEASRLAGGLLLAGGLGLAACAPVGTVEMAGNGVITVTGVLTDEGVECPAMRGEDGELYTLAGELGELGAGDRVRVQGTVAEMSFCMQGTTISVHRIERL